MSDTLDQEVETKEDVAPSDVETRARAMGWKPKEEYRGPPDVWRDAEAFVRHGETELPVLRERYRKVEQELARVSRMQAEGLDVIRDMTERTRKSEERGYKKALAELEAKRTQAIRDGDVDAVHAMDQERAELSRDAPRPAAPASQPTQQQAPAAVHPDAAAWDQKNPWFRTDADMRQAATLVHTQILQAEPHLSVAENLARVTDTIRAMFPGRVPALARQQEAGGDGENERRRQPASVAASSPAGGPARANPRSFESMPKDSKDAYHKYAKQLEGKGKPLTKEEWAATYYEQEG